MIIAIPRVSEIRYNFPCRDGDYFNTMKIARWSKTTTESNEFLENLFDAITDPVIVFDTELRIIKINKAAVHFFPECPVGKKCFTIKHAMTPICKDCPAWQSIRTGKPAFTEMYDPDTGDTLLIKTYPIFNGAGEVNAVALVGRVSRDVLTKWLRN
ncbi:MAG TPA: PAS domain-containing protein [Candidatus Brocadiia bacterium]|nr:PAS domain-containing protein [Planctomycetota bacterium]MDO8094235.1 PAS domain-containing protein [Candidatus Brocadiales bacterium]